ncbi:MAG: cellulase family glycosylhydrolase [Nevskiales bacterium]
MRSRLMMLALVFLTVLLATGCGGGSSSDGSGTGLSTAPQQLRRDGRWLVDPQGRVVLLHGVNMVWKPAPHYPPDSAEGFRAADADWLADHGFNTARIGTLWVGVAPEPDHFDLAYLAHWDRVINLLASRKIWMLFDFHQDMLGPKFQGEGVPEWIVDEITGPTTGVLGPPTFGFPFNYFTPQVSEAFDNLWAARGSPAWDNFRDAWRVVATRYRNQDYSMGYDLLNEPWPGMEAVSCIVPPLVGCPGSDTNELQPFFEHAIAGIRQVDRNNLVWMETQTLSGGTGNPTGLVPIAGENQLGYSFHNYCGLTTGLQSAQLPIQLPVIEEQACEVIDGNVFANAREVADRIGAVELLTEFGATDEPVLLKRVTRLADEQLVGWQYWHYKNWSDPTTQSQGSGAQSLFTDDDDLGTVKLDKLRILERSYPQATAGVPLALSFDPDTAEFSYRFTPRASATAPTEIYVPVALHYPQGYLATVSGATVTSAPNATRLVLANNAGATEVSVTVTRP